MPERPPGPPEKKTEPLRTDVEIFEDATAPEIKDVWIHVGNSGLSLRYIRQPDGGEDWHIDYTPEGKHQPDPENRLKYATILGHSLHRLAEWLDDPKNLRKADLPAPEHIEQMTNRTMYEAFRSLLGDAVELLGAEEEHDQYYCRLDMTKLQSDPGLIERLRAISERAERQNYTITE